MTTINANIVKIIIVKKKDYMGLGEVECMLRLIRRVKAMGAVLFCRLRLVNETQDIQPVLLIFSLDLIMNSL